MTPVSKIHLDEILSYSRNLQEAVEQIEAISVGAQLAPQFAHPGAAGAAPGMDPQVMEKLMNQRIENEMAKLKEANQAQLDEANAKLEKMEAALAKATATPKAGKKASKKTSPRKQPKGGILDRMKAKQETDENGDPVLTDEQEKTLAATMLGESR
tara:strand:- start:31392 stop:31859 length:468 start_codon:yes stop_codon:yes gene_type:complete